MKPVDVSLVTDRAWAVRKAISTRTPGPVRNWIMGCYHAYFRRWNVLATDLRLAVSWRGQEPRVYFPQHVAGLHPAWYPYRSQPPLRYAPYRVAELCHWINSVPDHPSRPCVSECEHILALGGDITNWQHGLQRIDEINRLVAQDSCRFVFTYSAGLVDHSRQYLRPDLWPKLGFLYPCYPGQPDYPKPAERPFTILTIASRFSDKGVPEALEAFQVLRERHGADVRMRLVSQAVPAGYPLPPGVVHYDVPRMSGPLRAQVYRSAHVLFIPCYSDTAVCFMEAYAFGVPVVTTRIHHADEFVRDGITGHLLETPIYSYSRHYGTRWKTWADFLVDVEAMRQRGELRTVVDQSVDCLEAMFSGEIDLDRMGRAARALHRERFSPEVHNERLLGIYESALR